MKLLVTISAPTISQPYTHGVGPTFWIPEIGAKICVFDADKYGQPITLRSNNDGLVLNLNAASLQTAATAKMIVEVVWTEDNS